MARVKLGLEDNELAAKAANGSTVDIPVGQIQGNPENPRPADTDVSETEADLRSHGQLQNINVMSLPVFKERKPHLANKLTTAPFVAVNGNLRVLAAPGAGLKTLSAVVRDDWSENDIDEAVVSENEHRKQMNHLLLGQHLVRMLPRYGGKHHHLAVALNKTQPWVSQHVGLTTLHPDLQEVVLRDGLPFRLTRECTRLHRELQPLLASGELPQDVALAWLLKLRLKADQQWERWQAGPPYLDEAAPAEPPGPPADPEEELPGDESKRDRPPALVIRIRGEWSAPTVVKTLRETLSQDQWTELVREITSASS